MIGAISRTVLVCALRHLMLTPVHRRSAQRQHPETPRLHTCTRVPDVLQEYPVQPRRLPPWDQEIPVQAARITKGAASNEGVVEYELGEKFEATIASLMLVGLVQAARSVHVADDGQLHAASDQHPPATVGKLVDAWAKAREAKTEEEFCRRFRDLHRATPPLESGAEFHYASNVLPAEKAHSWTEQVAAEVPGELQAYSIYNLCRLLGWTAGGVTTPYAYVGGPFHFFDIHFEEFGQAAVNAHVVWDFLSYQRG